MASILELVGNTLAKLVGGTRNEKLVRRYDSIAAQVTALEPEIRALSPEALRGKTDALRERAAPIVRPLNDWWANLPPNDRFDHFNVRRYRRRHEQMFEALCSDGVLVEAFAVLREASRRAQDHRHFDCQIVGGVALYLSKVAEMKTGEGKTIVCHLSAFMKVLEGKKVHVVTVNDYLVKRDAEFAQPIFELLGITVGYIQSQLDSGGYEGIRQQAYACDITYGTNNEFGFDYLRDNMKTRIEAQVQGRLDYSIVDEVDSILIDEARTPLIISGPSDDDVSRYPEADTYARHLIELQTAANRETLRRVESWGDNPPEEWSRNEKFSDALKRFKADPNQRMIGLTDDEGEAIGHKQYFVVQRDRKAAGLTQYGAQAAQERAGKGSFYHGDNLEWPHLIENSLRAHVVYERDKDYVVQNGEVIIVDEFTGRLMIGRQWSDGLHQAVEAKEKVTVKQESQTLATITIQNFFKLYQQLAGMTGTALTEAQEFEKIYRLDCMGVPTNRPVNRVDHDDKIYRTEQDKAKAIVEEINEVHRRGRAGDPYMLADVLKALRPIREAAGEGVGLIDEALAAFEKAEEGDTATVRLMLEAYDDAMGDLSVGRPVLVGTTSVEKSEQLSAILTREYGIDHEVLNAKNHAREAEIVAKAGHRHPPARGKDKTLRGNVTIATNMAGRGTDIKLELGVVYEKCIGDLGSGDENGSKIRKWRENGVIGTKCCMKCPDYEPATNCAHCWKPKIDPRFPALGRTVCPLNSPCGLHIVGTERHESRRIDNQLRGRAGRQGDPGSSRFFLSLEDDLMKLFMPESMIKLMEWLGLTGGAAIEHKRVNKAIEGAQKKVEERNFSTRKHLLEWDEPMDYQRKAYYTERQQILEGRGMATIIWRMIDQSCDQAIKRFLAPTYGQQCIIDWCRRTLELDVTAAEVDGDDLSYVGQVIRDRAVSEISEDITNSLGEYIDPELTAKEWDLRGLLAWAKRRFGLNTSENQLRRMNPLEIEEMLVVAAHAHYEKIDLTEITPYLDPGHGRRALVEWARGKFEIELTLDEIVDHSAEDVNDLLSKRVRAAYRQREIEFPVDQILHFAYGSAGRENAYGADSLVRWVNSKYNLDWSIDQVQGKSPATLRDELVTINEGFLTNGRLESEIDDRLREIGSDNGQLVEWATKRFGRFVDADALREDDSDEHRREVLLQAGRELLRLELTNLEQTILLQIYDQAWKDHLRDMDHKKDEVIQRSITDRQEQHPQSAFAREAGDLFQEMLETVRERVTGIIFKIRIGTGPEDRKASQKPTAFDQMQARHADSVGIGFVGADQQAGMGPQGEGRVTQTIRREQPKVRPNERCPCGSGKKYKHCHGKKAR